MLCISFVGNAQHQLKGKVKNDSGEVLIGATVQILDSYRALSTDGSGIFKFDKLSPGDYQLKVSYIGFETQIVQLTLEADKEVDITLVQSTYMSKEFTVVGTRLDRQSPMAYSNLDKDAIAKQNLGQDMPEQLSLTPSVVFTSDAGNGVGYTYMRMRGSDQSNINVTINGIPLNDAESQQVFWVDLPDLTSSTEDIQIQRGVGTSVNGSGAFGGSVNLQTQDQSTNPYGEVNLAYGSFNTMKATLKLGSGIINEHWSMAARGSVIQSDGYMDRSRSELASYFASLQYASGKTSLRLIAFGGGERTQQAWYGVPRERLNNDEQGMLDYAANNGYGPMHTANLLNSDRRYNYYLHENEVDDYNQYHNQLHWNQVLTNNWTLNVSAFYTKGKGYFEQYQYEENAFDDNYFSYYGIQDPVIGNDTITNSDFIRQRWLDNDFYGGVFSLNYDRNKWDVVIGGGINQYKGKHFGDVIWSRISTTYDAPFRYYENESTKNDLSVFAKANYLLNEMFSIYGDLQFRRVDYTFLGIDNGGTDLTQTIDNNFINPKIGLNAQLNSLNRAFVSFAVGNKEANRDDFRVAPPNDRPEHQTLYDLELGYSLAARKIAFDLVLYNMSYKNQLLSTGQINDVGEEVRTNVKSSFRRGVELSFDYKPLKWLRWNFNTTFSQNKINDHIEYVDNWDTWGKDTLSLGQTDIGFSPNVIVGSQIEFTLFNQQLDNDRRHSLAISLITKYVGKQFLDNTSDDERSIDAYFVNDLRLNYSMEHFGLKNISLIALVRNVFDVEYVSNGWVYKYVSGDELNNMDGLFPQAGINYMIGLNISF